MASISPSPSLAWRVPVLAGITTMKALSFSDRAWGAWEARLGPRPPRAVVRGLLATTIVLHVGEAAVVHRRATAAGLDQPGRWAFATLLYGFPVVGRLSRATAQAAAEAG